jgi:hypothetical protein
VIGTQDTDSLTNTQIIISGNTRSGISGNIDYVASNTGAHVFWTTDSKVEKCV